MGRRLEVIKQVGSPENLELTYGISAFVGTHGIGHTRLSTESRVDLSHSQPFWAHGLPDVAVVHNGHITNYHKLRRRYEQEGYHFYTENDSEIIGIYLAWKLRQGLSLGGAMEASLRDLDGSFSYLAATKDVFGFAKDPFCLKPLLVGESEGAIAVAKQDYAAARVAFEASLKVQPNFAPAMFNLARLDLAERKVDEAKARLEKITEIDRKNIEAYAALAHLALREDRLTDALSWYEKAANANPNVLYPRLRMIDLMIAAKDTLRAQSLARELLQRAPNQPDLLDALARAQIAAEDHKAAISTYRQLTQSQPNSPLARQRLARAYTLAKDEQGAIDTLREALNIDPNFLPALADLIEFEVKGGRGEVAVKMATDWRDRNPATAGGDVLIGEVLARLGRYNDAADAFAGGLKKEKNGSIVGRLANMQFRAGDKPAAYKTLEDWVRVNPDDQAALQILAAAYMSDNRRREAIGSYEKLVQRNPADPLALNNLAWLYGEVGDKRGVELAERAAKLAPRSDAIADTLGMLLVKFGQVEKGLKLLDETERRLPKEPELKWHLAQALKIAGRNEEARYKLQELLKLAPSFKDAEAARRMLQDLGG